MLSLMKINCDQHGSIATRTRLAVTLFRHALMSAVGHSRSGRASRKSGHVSYAPIATKFRSPAK